MNETHLQATAPQRLSKKAGFVVGAASGLAMTVLLVALRFIVGTQVVTEVVADWFTTLLPASIFDYLLDTLQFGAKRLLFVGIFAGQVVAGGLIGALYVRTAPRPRSVWQSALQATLLTTVLFVAIGAVLTPVAGGGLFGSGLPDGGASYSLALLLALVGFSLGLTEVSEALLSRRAADFDGGRRTFIRRAALLTAVVFVGGFAVRSIVANLGNITGSFTYRAEGTLSPEVTPNDQFYVVAKSPVVPPVDVSTWRLQIGGPEPMEVSYDELLAMPSIEEYVTLTCISNRIGGELIGNALWKGVPLRILLEQAHFPPETARVGFRAADGYFDAFPIDVAMRDEVIVAYEMNGVPLPPDHGFPARIIVPGLYGMENVKWLTEIYPAASEVRGYWQQRGWADTAIVKTSSRIDAPADSERIAPGRIEVGGVAFAGLRGISKVELSVDDGHDWQEAELRDPLSPFSWVLWKTEWAASMIGGHDVLVRATDGTGAVQSEKRKDNHPDGAEGYHEIVVRVTDPEDLATT